jgi:undecaprenyl diphosphate synthase
MDGNGRWAKKQGLLRTLGHQSGVKAVRDTVEAAAELGVKYLSLYAFSTENWKRPRWEVDALMDLLVSSVNKETQTLMENNIRLMTIGDTASLPAHCKKNLEDAIQKTAHNTRMTLILALSYSGRWDLSQATKLIAEKVALGQLDPNTIDDTTVSAHLCTSFCPDPELMIRTSGEHRISNFMLWQIAYTELYFTQKLWPDFRKEDFYEAIEDFQKRDRRYGMVQEQNPV